jgi:hypothetical protein
VKGTPTIYVNGREFDVHQDLNEWIAQDTGRESPNPGLRNPDRRLRSANDAGVREVMRSVLVDSCGCFPTGRHYAGIAHLLAHRRQGSR